MAALAVAGCTSPSREDAFEDQARAALLLALKDPASARIVATQVVPQPDGSLALCGSVDAKNALGEYAGFHDFVVHDGRASMFSQNYVPHYGNTVDAQAHADAMHRYATHCAAASVSALSPIR